MPDLQNNSISESLKELVIARLDVLPSNRKISVGADGEFTKMELIEHVKDGDYYAIRYLFRDMRHQVCLGDVESTF